MLNRLLLALLLLVAAPGARAQELVMVEQPGCPWCEAWDAEIGPIWPRTAEGRFAPLRRIDLDVVGDAISLQRRVVFTPTFLLVENDAEIARLEGYPGEDFFWPLITELLRTHTAFDGTS